MELVLYTHQDQHIVDNFLLICLELANHIPFLIQIMVFVIREVKSASGKGKGIPQALRAYCRVLSATSLEGFNPLFITTKCFTRIHVTAFNVILFWLMGFSHTELKSLTIEAAENDGRLARRALTDRDGEIQAHHMLLSQFIPMVQDHDAALKVDSIEVYIMRLKFYDWLSHVPI